MTISWSAALDGFAAYLEEWRTLDESAPGLAELREVAQSPDALQRVRRFADDAGTVSPWDTRPDQVAFWVDDLACTGSERRCYRSCLRVFFEWLYGDRIGMDSPALTVEVLTAMGIRVDLVDHPEQKAVLEGGTLRLDRRLSGWGLALALAPVYGRVVETILP